MSMPRISQVHHTKALMVDGKPYLMFAGEIHNSNASATAYFKEHVLKAIEGSPINTLLIPVYWEVIEKEEGVYDFGLLRELLQELRRNKLHAVLLWFGLWKNGISTYVPAWMKKDRANYPFVKKADGKSCYSITPLCKEAIEKDGDAFASLMSFLKEADKEHTVLMVQIENEMGILGSDRDYGIKADKTFCSLVPAEMERYLGKAGTWTQIFSEEAPERFMCYHYAKAVEYIAKRGKEHYSLPMFLNAWLKKEQEHAGQYPSGGPSQHNLDFYRTFAPSIDVFAPDIYVDQFEEICDIYAKQGILMVPETRQDVSSIANCIYAMAAYPMIGYAPFGIEDFNPQGKERELAGILQQLGIDKAAFHPEGSWAYLQKVYKDLQDMLPFLLTYRGTKHLYAFLRRSKETKTDILIDEACITIHYLSKDQGMNSAGFIIKTEEAFYIYGVQIMINIANDRKEIGYLSCEEGSMQGTTWLTDRMLNGDEQYLTFIGSTPSMLRIVCHEYD